MKFFLFFFVVAGNLHTFNLDLVFEASLMSLSLSLSLYLKKSIAISK
jgi:hypothetical protein